MLPHCLVSLLLIAVAQSAPRLANKALKIRNPVDDFEELGFLDPESDTAPIGTQGSLDVNIYPTEQANLSPDLQPEIGNSIPESTLSFPDPSEVTVTSEVPEENRSGNEGFELGSNDLLATNSVRHQNPPTTPNDRTEPQENTKQPPSGGGQTYGAPRARCQNITPFPWTDSGCELEWPRNSLTAGGSVKCRQRDSRAECVVCSTVDQKFCRPYKTIDLPRKIKIPHDKLIPPGQNLY